MNTKQMTTEERIKGLTELSEKYKKEASKFRKTAQSYLKRAEGAERLSEMYARDLKLLKEEQSLM